MQVLCGFDLAVRIMISGQDDHRITGFAPGFIQAVSCLPVTVEVMDCATIALVFFFADPPLDYGATTLSVTPAFLAISEIVSFSTLCPPQRGCNKLPDLIE
ncbi:hypothetical protein [Faecalibaculum rodentium]|nr:hypothetical protein [Faecalibaculum rodentium]